jgi:hypothetical protein
MSDWVSVCWNGYAVYSTPTLATFTVTGCHIVGADDSVVYKAMPKPVTDDPHGK